MASLRLETKAQLSSFSKDLANLQKDGELGAIHIMSNLPRFKQSLPRFLGQFELFGHI